MRAQEALHGLRAAVEHHIDVAVARRPNIFEELAALLLGQRGHGVAQLIQGLAQRRAPKLVEARLAAVAAAVGAPTLHPVHAAPRGIVHDLSFVLGRKLLQEAAVVGQIHRLVRFQQAQRIGQRHVSVLVVVAIGFAVGGHVDQLRLGAVVEAGLEPRGKVIAGVQQPLKCNGARNGVVVKEHCNRYPGVEAHQVGAGGVYGVAGRVAPACSVLQRADAPALVRGQHGEFDAELGQQLQRIGVGRGLRQPHALRLRAVVVLVVGNAPANLGDAVALVCKRKNDVVVDLRHGRAVAAEALAAAPFAVQNHAVGARRVLHQPAQQRRPVIEAHARIVVHDAHNLVLVVHDARRAVGRVTLRADALVPIVVGRGRVLRLHRLQPRILPRRLIKMTVNADKSFTGGHKKQLLAHSFSPLAVSLLCINLQ